MNLPQLLRVPVRLARKLLPATSASAFVDEIQRLTAVPRSSCDSSSLGTLSQSMLADLLADPELHQAWLSDLPELEALELPEMTGGVNPGDQRALYYLTLALRPRRVLEVGTHIGCSTVNLALALRRLAHGGRLVCADLRDVNDPVQQPWLEHGGRQSPVQMCQLLRVEQAVSFTVMDSLAYLKAAGPQFDLIFLDGSHEAEQVYQEIPLALKRLEPGGIILLHDYFPRLKPLWSIGAAIPGPYLTVERLRREGGKFRVRPLGALPWPTKLGSCVTSLAVLSR